MRQTVYHIEDQLYELNILFMLVIATFSPFQWIKIASFPTAGISSGKEKIQVWYKYLQFFLRKLIADSEGRLDIHSAEQNGKQLLNPPLRKGWYNYLPVT